jgi:excisionase family DNA binding protein
MPPGLPHASLEPTVPPGPAYLTPDQVAERLQVSPKTVYYWARKDPSMPVVRIGHTIRFPAERLRRWLEDREQGRPRTRRQTLAVATVVAKPAPDKEATSA